MAVRPTYYKCCICGEECGEKDPKLTGEPRIGHMECAEKATEEIRNRVQKSKLEHKCISFGADPDLKPGPMTVDDRGWNPNEDY